MREAWTLFWIAACAGHGSPAAHPSEGRGEQASGSDAPSVPPSEDWDEAGELRTQALRPEDAIGFARMDPTLDDCRPAEELAIEPRAWRIEDVMLVWVPCRAGAYQPSGALFLVRDDGTTERLALPYAGPDGGVLTDEATGEIHFDPSARELVDLVRFRGLGDCGRRLRFRVGPDGLMLVEHRERACNDEGHEGGPETWPLRFPALR